MALELPERIGRLDELAHNLWWSWHPMARHLFRVLDHPLWRSSGHNPVRELREMSPEKLQEAASDARLLRLYDAVMADFDAAMSPGNTWFETRYSDYSAGPVAYFSAEFAIHNSLPIYAGGLGVLAGDTCKEACDLGLPLVGVGFMYPKGYFHQHISANGWQEESYRHLDFAQVPLSLLLSAEKRRPLAQVQLGERQLHIGAWQIRLGRVNIYLLDTHLAENAPQDRELSDRLYIADQEQRIQQEIILGIGGVRVLRALGINPAVWHGNEGHVAFMMLERLREAVEEREVPFDQVLEQVRATTVFTTHTPVPAGHDVFSPELVEKYFHNYWDSLGIDQEGFLALGRTDSSVDQTFNMTALALRLSRYRNAVSQLHEKVSRSMWQVLWPDVREEEVPISHVTNGIHCPTWVAREMGILYEKYLGRDLPTIYDDPKAWERIDEIPDHEIWAVRQLLRHKLVGAMLQRVQEHWAAGEITAEQVLAMGALLDPSVLTLGFVRRFVEYKRPALILYDMDRLKRIVRDRWRPIQIVFAGKSHPADLASKQLLQRVYTLATDREFQGRIAFVEDYDMHMAHYLVQGVDLWLNNPRRLQEACGTSGMKAGLNGVPQLSVIDGWWQEGYNGRNGWAIGDGLKPSDPAEEDRADAEALYRLLEEEIVPLYYERDRDGIPHGWIRFIKESIRSITPFFCARRMLKEYVEHMYLPAARANPQAEPPRQTPQSAD